MRAQAGIEGMVLMALIGAVLAFTMLTFGLRSAEIDSIKISVEADKLCTLVKSSINSVWSGGEGSAAEISLPERLFAVGYTARIYAGEKKIVFSWKNSSSTCGILTTNITNSTSGIFDLWPGITKIRNSGGVVIVG